MKIRILLLSGMIAVWLAGTAGFSAPPDKIPELPSKLAPVRLEEISKATQQTLAPLQSTLSRILHEDVLKAGDQAYAHAHVFLLDDLRPEGVLVQSGGGDTFIGISVGALKLAKNEDEIAWLMAREIEYHRRRRSSSLSTERQIEQEAESAAIQRIAEKGRSPQAATDFSARAQALVAEGALSDRGTQWGSLHEITAAAKAALFKAGTLTQYRLGGISPQKTELATQLAALAASPEVVREIKVRETARLDRLFEFKGVWDPYFQYVHEIEAGADPGAPHPGKPDDDRIRLDELVNSRWRGIEYELRSKLPSEEIPLQKLRLRKAVWEEFRRSREAILGRDFKPQTLAGMEAYRDLLPGEIMGQESFNASIEGYQKAVAAGNPRRIAMERSALADEISILEPRITVEEFVKRVSDHQIEFKRNEYWMDAYLEAKLEKIGLKGPFRTESNASSEEYLRIGELKSELEFFNSKTLPELEKKSAAMRGWAKTEKDWRRLMEFSFGKLAHLDADAAAYARDVPHGSLLYGLLDDLRGGVKQGYPLSGELLASFTAWADKTLRGCKTLECLKDFYRITEARPEISGLFPHGLSDRLDLEVRKQTLKKLAAIRSLKELRDWTWNSLGSTEYMKLFLKHPELDHGIQDALLRSVHTLDPSIHLSEDERFALKTLLSLELQKQKQIEGSVEHFDRGFRSLLKHKKFYTEAIAPILSMDYLGYIYQNPGFKGTSDAQTRFGMYVDAFSELSEVGMIPKEHWSRAQSKDVERLWDGLLARHPDATAAFDHLVQLSNPVAPEKQVAHFELVFNRFQRGPGTEATKIAKFWEWAIDHQIGSSLAFGDWLGQAVRSPPTADGGEGKVNLRLFDALWKSFGEAARASHAKEARHYNDPDWVFRDVLDALPQTLSSEEDLRKAPRELIVEIADRVLGSREVPMDLRMDSVYRVLKGHADSDPRVAVLFEKREFIKKIANPTNFQSLAEWRIQKIPEVRAELMRLSKPPVRPTPKEEVRPAVEAAAKKIREMFGYQTDGRAQEIVDFIERKLVTTQAETRLLKALRPAGGGWLSAHAESSRILRLLPDLVDTTAGRLELASYLIGASDQPPPLQRVYEASALAEFRNSEFDLLPPFYRASVLQGIFWQDTKLTEDPAIFARVRELILGSQKNNRVLSKIFNSYFLRLPADERQFYLSLFLAKFDPRQGRTASIRWMLEGSGPLGGKAAQALVTSRLLPQSEREGLMGSFDDFLPPNRVDIHRDLEKIFGEAFVDIVSVERLAGSGSVNYVVGVVVKDPSNGRTRKLAVRIQKDRVAEKVENENTLWKAVAQDLIRDTDPDVSRMGRAIESIRTSSYERLKKGGVELDHAADRGALPLAEQIYGGGQTDPGTKLRTEELKAVPEWQARIAPGYQGRVSVYEYVESTPIEKIVDPARKRAIAQQMLDAEFKAIRKGSFDLDPHFRNWLIDLDRGRLVRIDTSQIVGPIAPQDLERFKRLMGLLIDETPGSRTRLSRFLLAEFNAIFPGQPGFEGLESQIEATIERAPHGPQTNFVEKLYIIQSDLEQSLSRTAGREVTLDLAASLRHQGDALFKLNTLREYAGDTAFLRKLAKFADIPLSVAAYPHVKGKLIQVARSVRDRLSHWASVPAAADGWGRRCVAKALNALERSTR